MITALLYGRVVLLATLLALAAAFVWVSFRTGGSR
jgi:hypothetical protein